MSLTVNLRHLENRNLVLRGELSLAELDLDVRDELIRVAKPVEYDVEIEKLGDSVLVQGEIRVMLECECVRCLKKFTQEIELNPWTLHMPLEGEEKVSVDNDCVDLTPFVREDILLEFPQHPLCQTDCAGLTKKSFGQAQKNVGKTETKPSAWAKLDKLKL
jgi:uncharacterized protein